MKKILCTCMALVLALASICAMAETDVQAELDAANAKIEELTALVEKYKPFYDAQIVATYGANGVVWVEDVQADYEAMASQYAQMGLDLEAYGMADTVKMGVVESAVKNGVILAKAAELGLDQFDEATVAEMEALAQQTMDMYIDYYVEYFYPEMEVTDEMRAEAEAYWAANGVTIEDAVTGAKETIIYEAVDAYATKDVAVTEDDVQQAYADLLAMNQEDYTNDNTYNSDRSSGVAIAWNPEGYRAVKHVLVQFDDAQAAQYSELQAQIESLNAEKAAIENPSEDAEATAEPRSIEEIDAEIAACAAEVETLYATLLPEANEVIDAFNAGTPIEELIATYNDDPGMVNGFAAENGYAVAAHSTAWDPAFTEGAMSIAEVGGISAPVYGVYGIHIIYYMADIPAGEVGLEAIRADVEADALLAKETEAYNALVASWIEEANVQYFYSNFGIAAV